MFGVPTVLNPYFFFPVVFTYPILAAITWISMNLGWVTKPFIYVPWSTPEPFYPWLATGGDWRAVALRRDQGDARGNDPHGDGSISRSERLGSP